MNISDISEWDDLISPSRRGWFETYANFEHEGEEYYLEARQQAELIRQSSPCGEGTAVEEVVPELKDIKESEFYLDQHGIPILLTRLYERFGKAKIDGILDDMEQYWKVYSAVKKRNIYWSMQELDDLKANYENGGVRRCKVALLQHTPRAVCFKALSLGLKVKSVTSCNDMTKLRWIDYEIADIKRNFKDKGVHGCKVAKLRHSDASIGMKAQQMGILNKVQEPRGTKLRWIDYEIADIKRNFKDKGVHGCKVAKLRHSDTSIRMKAQKIGLLNKVEEPRWTKAELRDLRLHFPTKGANECKLVLMRHTKSAIYRKVFLLGIKSERGLGASNRWTTEELKDVLENFPKGGSKACVIAKKKHTPAAICNLVWRKGWTSKRRR